LHVDLESIRDTLMARIKGEIDLATADELREIIDERLKKDSYKAIILDLGGVSFIDSSGLGFILGRYKKITGQGGKMYIVRARPSVSRVLELSGIKKLITVYDTENEVFKN
jgi:stage II sporulation protein AA (anti-sigma F factor antagonist)